MQNCMILCINLGDAIDRRTIMQNQLKKLDLEYTMISAVDARNNPELLKLQTPIKDRLAFRRNLRLGEIGCYLSHIKCCKLLLESTNEWALMIEDDVKISKNIKYVLQNIDKIPNSIHLFQVSSLFDENRKVLISRKKFKFVNGSYFVQIIKPTSVGTQGYFIDRRAAQEFIDISNEIQGPVDEVLFSPNFNFNKNIKPWVLMPVMIREFSDAVSTIEGRECGYGKISNLKQWADLLKRKIIKLGRKLLSTHDVIKVDK